MKIFAYGSNMHHNRLKNRVPSKVKVSNGYILGYKLHCTKSSTDGSGKATVVKTNNVNDKVWGVIFEIDENEKLQLDRAEGLNYGYIESQIEVNSIEEIHETQIYVAEENYINQDLIPYEWYKSFIVDGAKQNGLPQDYIEELETLESRKDSNDERKERADKILRGE